MISNSNATTTRPLNTDDIAKLSKKGLADLLHRKSNSPYYYQELKRMPSRELKAHALTCKLKLGNSL